MAKQAKVSRREYWRDVIERHQAGGLSIQRFCRREHLATATFFEWKRKLRRERGAPESSASRLVSMLFIHRMQANVRLQANVRMPADALPSRIGRCQVFAAHCYRRVIR